MFNVANMSFNAIHDNKIHMKISEFTVVKTGLFPAILGRSPWPKLGIKLLT